MPASPRLHSTIEPSHQAAGVADHENLEEVRKHWWDARWKRLFVAAVMLLVGFVIQVQTNPQLVRMQIFWRAGILLSEAFFVIGLTVLLTEAGPLRCYIEEGLAMLKEKMDEPVFDRLTNVSYLRKHFAEDYLHSFRESAAMALLPEGIEYPPDVMQALDQYLLPQISQVCRRHCVVTVVHELDTRAENQYLRQQITNTFQYFNLGNKEVEKTLAFSVTLAKLNGISENELFSDAWAEINGPGGQGTRQIMTFKKTYLANAIRFDSSLTIRIGNKPITVTLSRKSIIPITDCFRLKFYEPTTGLDITYHHPPDIAPELFCFGVAGELKRVETGERVTHWEYDGSFLPHHGVVLVHPLRNGLNASAGLDTEGRD